MDQESVSLAERRVEAALVPWFVVCTFAQCCCLQNALCCALCLCCWFRKSPFSKWRATRTHLNARRGLSLLVWMAHLHTVLSGHTCPVVTFHASLMLLQIRGILEALSCLGGTLPFRPKFDCCRFSLRCISCVDCSWFRLCSATKWRHCVARCSRTFESRSCRRM